MGDVTGIDLPNWSEEVNVFFANYCVTGAFFGVKRACEDSVPTISLITMESSGKPRFWYFRNRG